MLKLHSELSSITTYLHPCPSFRHFLPLHLHAAPFVLNLYLFGLCVMSRLDGGEELYFDWHLSLMNVIRPQRARCLLLAQSPLIVPSSQ